MTALRPYFKVVSIDIKDAVIPADLCRDSTVVYSVIEDPPLGAGGRLQSLLESRGVIYAGSDSQSTRLCWEKPLAKQCVAAAGMCVAPGFDFKAKDAAAAVATQLKNFGGPFVLKPADSTGSIGLSHGLSMERLKGLLFGLSKGHWMVETQIHGREISVGVLEGRALGLVEISPKGHGVFDSKHKRNKKLNDYQFPAVVTPELETEIKQNAERAFAICGCRDFARLDYMVSGKGECYFLEINSAPTMYKSCLMPKSAFCCGLDYTALCLGLVKPALERFYQIHK